MINIPTYDLAKQVVGIGNCSGADVDKFAKFKLTRVMRRRGRGAADQGVLRQFRMQGRRRAAWCDKYSFFIMEVVKAHAAISPKVPRTIHYRGDGQFMVSGREVSFRRMFRPENL